MRPFATPPFAERCFPFLSLFSENFLAHGNNAKVNFCCDDKDDDDAVGRGKHLFTRLEEQRQWVWSDGTIRRRLSNYGAAFYYFLTRGKSGLFFRSFSPGFFLQKAPPTGRGKNVKISNTFIFISQNWQSWPGSVPAWFGGTFLDYGAAAAGLPDSQRTSSSNSRKWSFPHRAPDIKLLTVAIWREGNGAQWFHFTVQILSSPPLLCSVCLSFCAVWGSVPDPEPWPRLTICLFSHANFRPSVRPPANRYCFIASNLVDLMACWQIWFFFSSLWAGFYVFRLFAAIFYARTAFSGFTIWRNGWLYGCAVGLTLFFADLIFFLLAGLFFCNIYIWIDSYI